MILGSWIAFSLIVLTFVVCVLGRIAVYVLDDIVESERRYESYRRDFEE